MLEILKSPLFSLYHKNQPFNENHLRPCSMLENPSYLRKLVGESNAHSTDLESLEDVDHLCKKCDEYSKEWAPVADSIWNSKDHLKKVSARSGRYENYSREYNNKKKQNN